MLKDLSVDDKTFLLEAIQRLCSSLTPEIAIGSFYEHIARFLPLVSFSLLSSAPEDLHPGEVVSVAHVSDAECRCPMNKIVLSAQSKRLAKEIGLDDAGRFDERLIISEKDPLFQYLNGIFPQSGTPLFVLRLKKEHALGTAHFAGRGRFTEHHLALMRGLEAPLCIAMGNLLQHNELEEIRSNILNDNQRLRRQLQGVSSVDIIGADHGLKQVMQKVRLVAPVDVPVLVTGETGTGKEVIAKALHELSIRCHKPFIAVNCGALPPTLIDSELFGFTRGSFTGATENRKGYFERADGGTLFLDEIGELPLEAQARLLRVLETHEINKIGGHTPIRLNIRLLAATNQDLQQMVEEGTFRKDLYFRLRVVNIALPPLRERKADIPALVQFLLHRSAARFGVAVPTLAEGELKELLNRSWPGNIRELQNVLEEALICAGGHPLRLTRIPEEKKRDESRLVEPFAQAVPTYEDMLRNYFTGLLHSTHGRISGPHGAAVRAGLKPGTFRFKCSQLGLLRPKNKEQ